MKVNTQKSSATCVSPHCTIYMVIPRGIWCHCSISFIFTTTQVQCYSITWEHRPDTCEFITWSA